MSTYGDMMDRARLTDPALYAELQGIIRKGFEETVMTELQKLAGPGKYIVPTSHAFKKEPSSWTFQPINLTTASNYIVPLLVLFFSAYFSYINDRSKPSVPSIILSKTFLGISALIIGWIAALDISREAFVVLVPAAMFGALVGRIPTLLPPSRMWPRRVQMTEYAPQSWAAAVGCMYGFMFSSGFFALAILKLQEDLK